MDWLLHRMNVQIDEIRNKPTLQWVFKPVGAVNVESRYQKNKKNSLHFGLKST